MSTTKKIIFLNSWPAGKLLGSPSHPIVVFIFIFILIIRLNSVKEQQQEDPCTKQEASKRQLTCQW